MKYSELFKKAVTELSAAGNEAPEYEARELMYHFLGTDRMFLIDRAVSSIAFLNSASSFVIFVKSA